jgi:hypothetical protein
MSTYGTSAAARVKRDHELYGVDGMCRRSTVRDVSFEGSGGVRSAETGVASEIVWPRHPSGYKPRPSSA